MRRTKRTASSWVQARDAALERDNWACQASEFGLQHVCIGRLVVHHRRRRSQGGTDTLDNLVSLCSAAHDHVHANPTLSYELGLMLRSVGVALSDFIPYQT